MIKDKKELLAFMRSCAKIGIQECSVGNISFRFSDAASEEAAKPHYTTQLLPRHLKVSSQARRAADTIEREEQENQNQRELEEELNELSLMDPLAYEERMLRENDDAGPRERDGDSGDLTIKLDEEDGDEESLE